MTGAKGPSGDRRLGFWASWALTTGCMIGSGVFTLPAVLAPYGLVSFGGWIVSAAGALALALSFASLAARTRESGGPYAYTRAAFGDLAGFVIGWGFWVSYVIAVPAIAVAFAGYLPVFAPALAGGGAGEVLAAFAIILVLTAVNLRGVKEMGAVQIATTLLKIAPLLAVAALGLAAGENANLPEANPKAEPLPAALAATALLTLWAFTGFEAGAVAASDVKDPERTIPRALVVGMLTVAFVYLAATYAVMRLVPADELARSSAPFADAARAFGPGGSALVAAGALVATAGALNGVIFVCGQALTALARDGLAPAPFARFNAGGAPAPAVILSSGLGCLLLLANYAGGPINAFKFLVNMSVVAILLPYLVCALANLLGSGRSAFSRLVSLAGIAFSLFAIAGSGLEAGLWGAVLLAAGLPVYALQRLRARQPAPPL